MKLLKRLQATQFTKVLLKQITNLQHYQQFVQEPGRKLLLVGSTWRPISPILTQIESLQLQQRSATLIIDEVPQLTQTLGVKGLPALYFYRNKMILDAVFQQQDRKVIYKYFQKELNYEHIMSLIRTGQFKTFAQLKLEDYKLTKQELSTVKTMIDILQTKNLPRLRKLIKREKAVLKSDLQLLLAQIVRSLIRETEDLPNSHKIDTYIQRGMYVQACQLILKSDSKPDDFTLKRLGSGLASFPQGKQMLKSLQMKWN